MLPKRTRLTTFEYLGEYRYFLTFCTYDRQHTFTDPVTAASVIAQILRTSSASGFELLAYCLMPDHAHLLVEGLQPSSDLRRFTKRLKQSSGQMYAHRAGHRLWQEGYYDRVLREGEEPKQVARYIIENPVRAGLVRSPLDYPFIGSEKWTLEELIDSVMW